MVVARLFLVVGLLLSNGIASAASIPPLFVAQSGYYELDALRLVEAPAGHLTGTLSVISYDKRGNRNTDVVHNVTGGIYQNGVSLQIEQGIFAESKNLVGHVDGQTLTLSYGNSTEVFHAMSQTEYRNALDSVGREAAKLHTIWLADEAVAKYIAAFRKLTKDIQQYLDWGKVRIQRARVTDLDQWYASRLKQYRKCFDTILPLAERGVDVRRWKGCVIAIRDDKSNREQMVSNIASIEETANSGEKAITKRINELRQRFSYLVGMKREACAATSYQAPCLQSLENWRQDWIKQLEQNDAIREYHALLPKFREAIETDRKRIREGDEKLVDIANKLDAIYTAAQLPSG